MRESKHKEDELNTTSKSQKKDLTENQQFSINEDVSSEILKSEKSNEISDIKLEDKKEEENKDIVNKVEDKKEEENKDVENKKEVENKENKLEGQKEIESPPEKIEIVDENFIPLSAIDEFTQTVKFKKDSLD